MLKRSSMRIKLFFYKLYLSAMMTLQNHLAKLTRIAILRIWLLIKQLNETALGPPEYGPRYTALGMWDLQAFGLVRLS